MKTKLLKLLPVLLLLCAVVLLRQNKDPQMTWIYVQEEAPALVGVSFLVEKEHYENRTKSIEYAIANLSQEEISGGEPGGLYYVRAEQWSEHGWRYWAIDPDQEFPEGVAYAPAAVGLDLMPGSTSQEFSLPLKEMLPEVTPGRYRLAWDFKTGSHDEGWQNYTVYQEFTIEP